MPLRDGQLGGLRTARTVGSGGEQGTVGAAAEAERLKPRVAADAIEAARTTTGRTRVIADAHARTTLHCERHWHLPPLHDLGKRRSEGRANALRRDFPAFIAAGSRDRAWNAHTACSFYTRQRQTSGAPVRIRCRPLACISLSSGVSISTRRNAMRHMLSRGFAAAIIVTAGLSVAACHHHHHRRSDGPATRAGQHVDHAADRAGDAIENTGRTINRALPGD
jgi:hypothetical protein